MPTNTDILNNAPTTPDGAGSSPAPQDWGGGASLASGPARPHLAFLDGLRGLAALYVATFHAYNEVNYKWQGGDLPSWVRHAALGLTYGHAAVGVFIVLSGYCLMLPVVRTPDGQLQGGIAGFLRRRSLRILPPYYAALALSILMLACTGPWQRWTDTYWYYALPGLNAPVILSHVFLIHDFSRAWIIKINPPLWSVAVEFQIYLVFALLLLPVWRRFGMAATLALSFALGLLPHVLLPADHNFDWVCPWYLGLFALGMAGAAVNFGPGRLETRLRDKTPWLPLCVVFALAFLVDQRLPMTALHQLWLEDIITGLCAICLIVFCARASVIAATAATPADATHPWLARLLARPALVQLGAFSYSLYLVHHPLIALFYLSAHNLPLTPAARLGLTLFVFLPLTVGGAYLFHLAFERPFQKSRARKEAAPRSLDTAAQVVSL